MVAVCYPGAALYPDYIWFLGIIIPVIILIILGIYSIPFLPFMWAKLAGKKVIVLLDRTGLWKAKVSDIRNQMYYLNKQPFKWLKQYHKMTRMAGVPVDFAHWDTAFVLDEQVSAAFAEIENMGYANIDEVQADIKSGKLAKEGLPIPLFFTVPWDIILKYGREISPAAIQGQVEDSVFVQKAQEQADKTAWLKWAIFIAIILLAGALGYAIISRS